jgi:hypothetical protein
MVKKESLTLSHQSGQRLPPQLTVNLQQMSFNESVRRSIAFSIAPRPRNKMAKVTR